MTDTRRIELLEELKADFLFEIEANKKRDKFDRLYSLCDTIDDMDLDVEDNAFLMETLNSVPVKRPYLWSANDEFDDFYKVKRFTKITSYFYWHPHNWKARLNWINNQIKYYYE